MAEAAISQLSPDDLAQLASWFAKFHAKAREALPQTRESCLVGNRKGGPAGRAPPHAQPESRGFSR
jgi:hypothetical protein